jgi:hypothetical protein
MINNPFVRGSYIESAILGESYPDQLKTGDFNGDGATDLVVVRIHYKSVGDVSSPIQVFLGNGAGQFVDKTAELFSGVIPTINYVPRMIIADFNNDKVDDIFCIDNGIDKEPFTGGQNSIFLSAGGKLVDARSNLPQGLKNNHGASAGDVNKDGKLDLLINALMNDGNDLQINDGYGRFISSPSLMPSLTATPSWATDPSIKTVQTNTYSGLIDVNQDGYVDMILGTWDHHANPSQVLLNQGGTFAKSAPISLPRSGVNKEVVLGVEPIDLNGDALPDLALSITNGGSFSEFYHVGYVQLLVNQGGGIFRDETQQRLPQTVNAGVSQRWYKSVNVADINRDGYSDLMIDNYSAPPIVYLNDGFGKFQFHFEVPQGFNFGAIGDVDNDGMLDLITRDGYGFVTWLGKNTNQRIYKANFGGEKLLGSSGNDQFYLRDGTSTFNGADGLDTAFLSKSRNEFSIQKNSDGSLKVSDLKTGTEAVLKNVERISFSDVAMAFDSSAVAGKAYRIYKAAFDRTPDLDGLGYWMSQMDKGMGVVEVAARFIDSAEFRELYGANVSSTDFLTKVYSNVLDRTPDSAGLAWWVNEMKTNPAKTWQKVLADFSESTENQANVAALISGGIDYTNFGV